MDGPIQEQLEELQQQLAYFQAWARSLATAAAQPRALDLDVVQSTLQLIVTGLPAGTTEDVLEAFFNDLAAAHGATVAPGSALAAVQLTQDGAQLELRCCVEASNFLAFDGVELSGATLKVQRPKDYCRSTAVLLGPCQPNPAVVAAVRRAWHANPAQHAKPAGSADAAAVAPDPEHPSFAAVAASKVAATGGHSSCCSFAAAVRSGAHPAHPRVAATPDFSCCAGSAEPCGSSAACKVPAATRDLLPAADQSKQDEVFIGGLPSHWKAQQVKELLTPYGQLKSLSVAMDAATGKNKGYAFVVFASSAMVAEAIEELDCRVVEGKILAVQRATDGKAAGSSGRESMTGSDTGVLRDGGNQQQPLAQQHRPVQRMTSGSLAPCAAPGLPAAAEACHAAAAAGAGPVAAPVGQQAAVALAAAGGDEGATLGQRLLAAVSGAGGGGCAGAGAAHGLKQYDINELYIGDLPLTYDEDAVRRLLGRYGKIKYFTLRNGRDKNFAFVKYKDNSVVDAAIQGLHGKIVDGYFLNVRRAIEGKQQQQQQQWATAGAAKQQQQQQLQLGRGASDSRASCDSRASFDASSRAARLWLSLDQQLHAHPQQQKQQQLMLLHKAPAVKGAPPAAAPPGFGRGLQAPGTAAAAAGGTSGPPQQQQQPAATGNGELLRAGQQVTGVAAAPPTATPAAEGSADAGAAAASAALSIGSRLRQQDDNQESAAASVPADAAATALDPPPQQQQLLPAVPARASGTAPGELQPQLPQAVVAPAPQPLPQPAAYRHQPQLQLPQQHAFQPPPPLQQQQQQSLFMHHGPSASWGVPGEAASSGGNGGRGCQAQQPRQSLLQTWDMLSPWSLFSHTAQ